MQISHSPVPGRKLPRVIGGSTESTKEICETFGLPIPMVPRLHQFNGYIKKEATSMESSKMYFPSRCRYRTHQCGAANYPVSWGTVQDPPRKYAKLRAYQYPWYRVSTNAMVILKRKLRAWRVQKCIALVGADIALTSAGPQTTPCHGVQYRVHQGNMRNFGPSNTHGTVSAPMQWLYQKEATGMES